MSLSEVYINLLSFEMRFVQRHGTPTNGHAPAANYASRGGRGGCHGGRFVGCSGGRNGGRNSNGGDHNDRAHCQICGCTLR
jgi:hypothetical protein